MIEFFMHLTPPRTTHQMKRVDTRGAKPRFFDAPAVKEARQLYRQHLAPHQPEAPIVGPVQLVTKWCYSDGQSVARYKITTPDTDNMVKLLKDEMTRLGFWGDDAQVASEITEKFWAKPAGIYVRVTKLKENAL